MIENRLPFRPLDNSGKTQLSYSLETQHWLRSLKASQNSSTTSLIGTLGFIGAVLSIIVNLVIIVLILLIELLQLIITAFGGRKKPQVADDHEPLYIKDIDDRHFQSW